MAAPEYLDAAGTPQAPTQLVEHQSLIVPTRAGEMVWLLVHPRHGELRVELAARLASDDLETLKRAALAGLGIAALPAYLCREERAAGRLRIVLPGWSTGDSQITLLMPPLRGRLPAVRALADFLVEGFPPLLEPDLPD